MATQHLSTLPTSEDKGLDVVAGSQQAPIPNFTCIPGVQGLKNGRSCDVLKAEPSQRLNSANRLRTQKHLFILTKIQGAAWAGIGEDKGKIQYEKEQSRKR